MYEAFHICKNLYSQVSTRKQRLGRHTPTLKSELYLIVATHKLKLTPRHIIAKYVHHSPRLKFADVIEWSLLTFSIRAVILPALMLLSREF